MKRHSIISTISRVTFLILPIIAASCGGDSGEDLFGSGNPKTDAGNTGSTGGQSGNGGAFGAGAAGGAGGAGTAGTGASGTGARSSGGSAGTGDASAGRSGSATGGVNGTSATGGTTGTGTGGTTARGGTTGTSGRGGSAGSGATGGSVGTAGSAGSAGTSGSAGTGGASGSTGSAGDGGPDASGGTAGADAGTDAGPRPCTNNSQCKSDEFCSKLSCALLTGECKPRPKLCVTNESPVCGCDAVNYWNDCLRQQVGTASSTTGECLTPAPCGGLVGYTCPLNRASCAHLLATELQCGVSDAFGTCWVIPEQCPQIVVGSSHRPCTGTDRCLSKCEAIKTEHDYFTDSTCPQ